jgi:ABC-type phosphate transport system substrate-binding protein
MDFDVNFVGGLMRKLRKSVAAIGAVGAFTALVFVAGSASADDQPTAGDVVGVGSDTVQYASDFLADGDNNGDAGYNGAVTNRDMSFFATGDGNGRALYDQNGQLLIGGNAGAGPTNLQGTTTIVLRQGTKPVARPDGSGDGIAALTEDSVGGPGYEGLSNNSINYARASRLPKGAEQTACSILTNCGGLHVYEFADDNLEIAKWTGGTSNAFPLSVSDLKGIYNCTFTTWASIPDAPAGASTHTIIPVIPQPGSGTQKFFLADIGLSAPGTCTEQAEEHDPTGITHAFDQGDTTHTPDPANAIEPFSVGRALLAASGYFSNTPEPATDFKIGLITGCKNVSSSWTGAGFTADQGWCGTTADPADGTQLINGGTPIQTTADGAVYDNSRGLYFIVRDHDLADHVPFQPGTTKNFAQVLFSGAGSFAASNASLIESAFLQPNYHDENDNSSG